MDTRCGAAMGETRAQPAAAARGRREPPGEENPKPCCQAMVRGCCPHGRGDFSIQSAGAGLGPCSEQGPESPAGAELGGSVPGSSPGVPAACSTSGAPERSPAGDKQEDKSQEGGTLPCRGREASARSPAPNPTPGRDGKDQTPLLRCLLWSPPPSQNHPAARGTPPAPPGCILERGTWKSSPGRSRGYF